jgi:C-terminal processing protease CtpA/Prc
MKNGSLIIGVFLFSALAVTSCAEQSDRCPREIRECLEAMYADHSEAPWLGVDLEKDDLGRARVTEVVSGSPAEIAGFRVGDVILTMGGREFSEIFAKTEGAPAHRPGDEVTFTIDREGERQELTARLIAMPRESIAEWIGMHVIEEHLSASATE